MLGLLQWTLEGIKHLEVVHRMPKRISGRGVLARQKRVPIGHRMHTHLSGFLKLEVLSNLVLHCQKWASLSNGMRKTEGHAHTQMHVRTRTCTCTHYPQLGGRLFCRLEKLDGKMENIRTCELARTVALEKMLAKGEASLVIPQAKVCPAAPREGVGFGGRG